MPPGTGSGLSCDKPSEKWCDEIPILSMDMSNTTRIMNRAPIARTKWISRRTGGRTPGAPRLRGCRGTNNADTRWTHESRFDGCVYWTWARRERYDRHGNWRARVAWQSTPSRHRRA
jgi:hypothetical protein